MTRVDKKRLTLTGEPKFQRRPRASRRSREEIKAILLKVFRERFPHDTVDISDGYKDNIHIVVVSKQFEKMPDSTRQDFMWEIVDSSSLKAEEKQLISLMYPVSPTEIK